MAVGVVEDGLRQQVVLAHEIVEDIGPQHQGARDGDRHPGVFPRVEVPGQDAVHEGQAAGLAADGAAADDAELGIVLVKRTGIGDDGAAAAGDAGRRDQLLQPRPRRLGIGGEGLAHRVGQGELGAGAQPAVQVAAGERRLHGAVRQLAGGREKLVQVGDALASIRFRSGDHQVAEAELAGKEALQVAQQGRRILGQEGDAGAGGHGLRSFVARLQQHGQARFPGAHRFHEADPRLRVDGPVAGKAGVGDDAQELVLEFLEDGRGLLVGRGQVHARPGVLAQQPLREGEVLLEQRFGQVAQHGKNKGQVGGIEVDGVLDQQDVLHSDQPGVALGVPAVLDELDDPQQHVAVALPDEDPLQGAAVVQLEQALQLRGVVGQSDHRQLGVDRLHLAAEGKGVHVAKAHDRDDQVEFFLLDPLQGVLAAADADEAGDISQLPQLVCFQQQVLQAPVLLQHEIIVEAGHQQELLDLVGHETVDLVRGELGGG